MVCVLFLPYALSLAAVCVYAFAFRAYELIIIGMFIDAGFGAAAPFPYLYTVSYGVIMFCAEFLKPWFSFYNTEREL